MNPYVYEAEVLRVVDGDTLDLRIDLGFNLYHKTRVRLSNVDTPEVYGVKKDSVEYQQGKIATERVENWVKDNGPIILVETHKTGKYGRWIADIYPLETGISLNEYLLNQGYTLIP